ncbi:hypothetical protein BYT27DRAFT_7220388 [Phlegmacium glaucopus]|nr:hypothetical protein BYT27DRAFT_7220388 [Phlegmacium glaucopus]
MPAEPFFLNNKLENLVQKCIIFPADGSETRIVHMIARTVTREDADITLLSLHSRCVDMASTFGDEYHNMRVMAYRGAQDGVQSTYLFFYNLSPNLPINLNVAHLIGVQPQSEQMNFIVKSLDADLSALRLLEEFLREEYQEGSLDLQLYHDEQDWELFSPSNSYWDRNTTEKEENFLHDLNELRCAIG